MLGPSTGIPRRFKRSEGHAACADLVFIMLGGVSINLEDHWSFGQSQKRFPFETALSG
jgi:hypothetical protein